MNKTLNTEERDLPSVTAVTGARSFYFSEGNKNFNKEGEVSKMTVIGKLGKVHGKSGSVKIIPEGKLSRALEHLKAAVVCAMDGEMCEVRDIRRYNRGRYIGTLEVAGERNRTKKFQGAAVFAEESALVPAMAGTGK
jgi:ribosomal 30S subunit maturation factor RimM